MPYNPGVTDLSGQILAQSINGAVSGVVQNQKAIYASQDELEKELAHLNGTVSFAAQKGILTPQDMDEYIKGNLAKKREMAVKAGMGYSDYLTQQQQQNQQQRIALEQQGLNIRQQEATSSMDLGNRGMGIRERMAGPQLSEAEANAIIAQQQAGFKPTEADIATAGMGGKTYVQTPKGWTLTDMPDTPLTLTPEEAANYEKSGLIPVRTSKGQFYPASIPSKSKDGQPIQQITLPNGDIAVVAPKDVSVHMTHQPPPPKPLNIVEQNNVMDAATRIVDIDKELADHQKELAGGDKRFGWFNIHDRKDRMAELQTERDQKVAQLATLGRNEKGMPFNTRNAINNNLPLPQQQDDQQQAVQVSSPEEAAKLPKGTPFITPDGRKYIRQ